MHGKDFALAYPGANHKHLVCVWWRRARDTERSGVAMSKTGFVAGGLLAIALLASGCMSGRVKTDLLPEADPALTAPGGTFYVADLKFTSSSPQSAEYFKKYQAQLTPLLRKECLERYPALFTEDFSRAIPLQVELINTTTMHNLKTMGWMYGTLLISGVILPCPGDSDEDYDVGVSVWTGREELRGPSLQKTFRRENHTWVSLLTPAALITIPGESDFPKTSGSLFNMQRMEKIYLQQLAPQVATAVAKLVAEKEAEFWTMQPRYAQPAYYSPTPSAAPGSPTPAPSALPLPTPTAAPF